MSIHLTQTLYYKFLLFSSDLTSPEILEMADARWYQEGLTDRYVIEQLNIFLQVSLQSRDMVPSLMPYCFKVMCSLKI